MSTGVPPMLIKSPYFFKPISVPDRPGIVRQDKDSLINQAVRVIDGMQEFGEKVYTSQLVKTYNILFDAAQKDLLKIYALENTAILEGKSRIEVKKISKDYVASVISNKTT